jgi:Ca2+-binding EF-hand superfamily protein
MVENYKLTYSGNNNCISNLPYEIEYEFCKMLEIQLSLVRILEKLLFELNKRKDFSIYDLYNELKDEDKDEISFIKLSNFMKRNIKNSNNDELRVLFKKLDINRDGSITMDDICVIFGKNIFNSQIHSDDDLNNNNNTELISSTSKEQVSQNLLIEFYLLLIEVEKIIELEKIELSSKSDFNIDDALNIFRKSNPDYISASELKNGLINLGIIANNDEVELLIKKYSTNNEYIIDNSDFFDMLVPFDKNYREIVEKRKPLPYLKNKAIIFSDLTRQSLVNFFKIIISCEITLEKKRKYLRKNVNINFNNFYNMIDIENKGFICINDFFRFFSSLNSEIETKYIYLLFLRIDRKKLGIIEQIDLMNEILPKI